MYLNICYDNNNIFLYLLKVTIETFKYFNLLLRLLMVKTTCLVIKLGPDDNCFLSLFQAYLHKKNGGSTSKHEAVTQIIRLFQQYYKEDIMKELNT